MITIKSIVWAFILILAITIQPGKLLAETGANANSDGLAESEVISAEIKAEDLGVNQSEVKLPGTFGYWWNNTKIKTQGLLTTDKAKKTELKIKAANLNLLAAKKLAAAAETDKNKEKLKKALSNYLKHFSDVENRLSNVPEEKRKAILEKMDEQQIKHVELFRRLIEQAPQDLKPNLEDAKKQRLKEWYEKHQENLDERLNKAIEKNSDGSQFKKELEHLTTLSELKAELPDKAKDKIESTILLTEDKLKEKLESLNANDQKKFEAYLEKMPTNDLKKAEIINRLQAKSDSSELQDKLEVIKEEKLEKIRQQFNNLDDNAKEQYLKENFGTDAEAIKVELLKKIKNDAPQLRAKIQSLNEQQQEQLKAKIQQITNKQELEVLQKIMDEIGTPVLKKEIQERRDALNTTQKAENLRPLPADPVDLPQVRPLYNSGRLEY